MKKRSKDEKKLRDKNDIMPYFVTTGNAAAVVDASDASETMSVFSFDIENLWMNEWSATI